MNYLHVQKTLVLDTNFKRICYKPNVDFVNELEIVGPNTF